MKRRIRYAGEAQAAAEEQEEEGSLQTKFSYKDCLTSKA